jgi:hypothetical protein
VVDRACLKRLKGLRDLKEAILDITAGLDAAESLFDPLIEQALQAVHIVALR